jgi:hypothetical protein
MRDPFIRLEENGRMKGKKWKENPKTKTTPQKPVRIELVMPHIGNHHIWKIGHKTINVAHAHVAIEWQPADDAAATSHTPSTSLGRVDRHALTQENKLRSVERLRQAVTDVVLRSYLPNDDRSSLLLLSYQ